MTYRVNEFAELAGVTVRALHHYDRLGLLKAKRNGAGYRLYADSDLERLEQIAALKFLGVPLKQIKTLLASHPLELPDALRLQRHVLEKKRHLLETAIAAIRDAEQALQSGRCSRAAVLKRIIEVIEMQADSEWTEKYYSEQARATIEERKSLWSPELQERVSKEWSELFPDVEAALEEDPAGEKAQALADRWLKLVEGFTGGDPEVAKGLYQLYSDRANWPAHAKQQMEPFSNGRVCEYMSRVMAARKRQAPTASIDAETEPRTK